MGTSADVTCRLKGGSNRLWKNRSISRTKEERERRERSETYFAAFRFRCVHLFIFSTCRTFRSFIRWKRDESFDWRDTTAILLSCAFVYSKNFFHESNSYPSETHRWRKTKSSLERRTRLQRSISGYDSLGGSAICKLLWTRIISSTNPSMNWLNKS